MSMDLWKYRTILELKLAQHIKLPHSIWNTLLLQIELVSGNVLKCLFYALSTLLKLLLLLIAQRHIMEEYEQIEFISAAKIEIDHIHDSVGFLQQV